MTAGQYKNKIGNKQSVEQETGGKVNDIFFHVLILLDRLTIRLRGAEY